MTDDAVQRFIAAIEELARIFLEVPRILQFDRDPKDEPYLNLAVATGASYLVTRDKDLLDLADASTPDGKRLRHHTPKLRIVEPRAFLVENRNRLITSGI